MQILLSLQLLSIFSSGDEHALYLQECHHRKGRYQVAVASSFCYKNCCSASAWRLGAPLRNDSRSACLAFFREGGTIFILFIFRLLVTVTWTSLGSKAEIQQTLCA
jgi:hypothetical protein